MIAFVVIDVAGILSNFQAVLDRVDEQFEFPLPEEGERHRMLQMFFDEYILMPTRRGKQITVDPEVNEEYLRSVARRTQGFSGRQIAKLVIAMQSAVFGSGTNTLTAGLAETVVNWKLAHFLEDVDTLDRRTNSQQAQPPASSRY